MIYRYENTINKLYYKSLTDNLDEYIDCLKSNGKLSNGEICFEIMTGEWMDKSVGIKMYRYKDGYYCWLNGLLQPISQDYLKRIIRYFTMDSWESFCYNDHIVSPKLALKIFNERIDTISIKTEYKCKKIIDLFNVSIYYQNDSLICKGINRNYGQVSHLLPFSNNSRDFIICGETIYVIEKNDVINKIELTQMDFTGGFYEQGSADIFPKWINFKTRDGYFLSYSMKENKFYKL